MTSDSSSDTDFEQVGASDYEWDEIQSDNEFGDDDKNKEKEVPTTPPPKPSTTVAVELPPNFLKEMNEPLERHPSSQDSSYASSFFPVQKMGALGLQSLDTDSRSSWSFVNTGVSTTETSSVAGSSVISGFDCLDINGSTLRRCQRCSFLNPENSTLCSNCPATLVANPCLAMDEQIARNLQRKEEQEAFERLVQEEKKRKGMTHLPLFEQAQVLTRDIVDAVESFRTIGYTTLPEVDLKLQASDFIACVRELGGKVALAYTFSAKDNFRFNDIRRNGFGANLQVSTKAEAALKLLGDHRALYSIREERSSPAEVDRLGWIVATVADDTLEYCSVCTVKDPQGGGDDAEIKTLRLSGQSLPLVCFDSSLRHQECIQALMVRLSQACLDFFHTDWSQDPWSAPAKRVKHSNPPGRPPSPNLLTFAGKDNDLVDNTSSSSVSSIEKDSFVGFATGTDRATNESIDRATHESEQPEMQEFVGKAGDTVTEVDNTTFLSWLQGVQIGEVVHIDRPSENPQVDASVLDGTPALSEDEEKIAATNQKMLKLRVRTDAAHHNMTLSKDEEIITARYRKMLKLGVPTDAVRHKMTKEKIDLKIVEAVLGSLEEAAASQREPAGGTAALTKTEEKTVEMYRHIHRFIKIPVEAMRQEMIKDGVSEKVVLAVLDPSEEKSKESISPDEVSGLSEDEERKKIFREWPSLECTWWPASSSDSSAAHLSDTSAAYETSSSFKATSQKWDGMFECLLQFVRDRKEEDLREASDGKKKNWKWDGNIPTNYKTQDGRALGRWINNQRSAKTKGTLKEDREEKLVSTGLQWSVLVTNSWDDMMNELRIYVNEQTKNGGEWDGNVPIDYRIRRDGSADDDKNLGRWVNRQRSLYQSGKLRKDRQLQLEKIGLKWSILANTSWESMYQTLCEYVKERKALDPNNVWDGYVPAKYETKDNPPKALGRWINRQRSAHTKNRLQKEFVDKLTEVGLKWAVHERITDEVSGLSGDEEQIAAKYRKMLKLGVPPGAVCHKMTRDQIDSKIVKAVLY